MFNCLWIRQNPGYYVYTIGEVLQEAKSWRIPYELFYFGSENMPLTIFHPPKQ